MQIMNLSYPPSSQAGTAETASEMCRKCGRGSTFPELYKKGESVVIAPGYELSRTKSNIAVSLCDEFFNRIPPPKPFVSRPTSENQTEQLVTDLQKQITQLVQLLEKESLKQMSIENKFQNEGKETSLKLQRLHEEELRKIAEMHSIEIGELQNTFAELMEEERVKAEKIYSDLKIQYQTLQASFISFKESITEELNARWRQKEIELIEKHESEMRRELTLQKNSLQRKCDEEKQLIIDNYEEQVSSIINKHNEEMEEAAKQYNSTMDTILELKNAKQEIKHLQEQLEQKIGELKNQAQYLSFIESQLTSDRAKLAEIEGTYKTNVGVMKRQFVVSIKALEDQNLDLKQLFAIKAEELCALKAAIEQRERQDKIEMRMSLNQEHGRAFEMISPGISDILQTQTPTPSQEEVNNPDD
ncbi:flagellum-associated coiled-coil domain-containing protein 1-like [Scyliorhinus canicula]|uniref:flagellum-associated coiled-coil domain-containing protein 1-like n=1 Tax=Scyliorhinus canicula TaxID=7830 RepID=UPI0018F32B71|nr:flagellum-associated coiled-coil domain-containing protein 1-like [Scyliorhinus canicula]